MTRLDARPDRRKAGLTHTYDTARHEDETRIGRVPDEPLVTDLGTRNVKNAFTSTYDPSRDPDNQVKLSALKWPDYAAPYVEAWDGVIGDWQLRGLSVIHLTDLRAFARADVRNTLAELKDASPTIRKEWARWYPSWARAEAVTCLRGRLQRLLDRQEEKAQQRADHNAKTDRQRLRGLAERFVQSMRKAGGALPNTPESLARAMSVSRPVTPERAADVVRLLSAAYVIRDFGSRVALLDMRPDLDRIFRR